MDSRQRTVFNKYTIRDGERPDTMAERLYGTSERDWIIILTAGITNIKNEWPLGNYDLYRYVEAKYGTELNDIHHYETREMKNDRGEIVVPKGLNVPKNYRVVIF